MTQKPLAGRTIALPETRELDLLSRMVAEQGANVLKYPMVEILDAPDSAPVEQWLRDLIDGKYHDVIFFTGEGIRRLQGFAARIGLEDSFIQALAKVRKITRGPKPVVALRKLDLKPDRPASEPTTDGVIAALKTIDLRGRNVGVQLYGEEPNPPLSDYLELAGARASFVWPYIYSPASDDSRVVDLIEQMARGRVDAIAFTSSPQVRRLREVAARSRLTAKLEDGLAKTKVAAVGPVVQGELERKGITVHIHPESAWQMRSLVNEIIAAFQDQ